MCFGIKILSLRHLATKNITIQNEQTHARQGFDPILLSVMNDIQGAKMVKQLSAHAF